MQLLLRGATQQGARQQWILGHVGSVTGPVGSTHRQSFDRDLARRQPARAAGAIPALVRGADRFAHGRRVAEALGNPCAGVHMARRGVPVRQLADADAGVVQ